MFYPRLFRRPVYLLLIFYAHKFWIYFGVSLSRTTVFYVSVLVYIALYNIFEFWKQER